MQQLSVVGGSTRDHAAAPAAAGTSTSSHYRVTLLRSSSTTNHHNHGSLYQSHQCEDPGEPHAELYMLYAYVPSPTANVRILLLVQPVTTAPRFGGAVGDGRR
jgi:hypothetical protein